MVEFEITESTIMADPFRALAVLKRLHEMGTKLSIDDFGTGYSSLAYLKRLPVDAVKIDKSFVLNMVTDENDAAIVRSTIDLARNLGLAVVAEGVEDEAIWRTLAALGCDFAQGHYLSMALPAAELVAWLQRLPEARTPGRAVDDDQAAVAVVAE
jgi:diguanylate cyclase